MELQLLKLSLIHILFLDYNNSIENFDYYYGAIEPFSIKIENNKTILQSNLITDKIRKQKESTAINVDGVEAVSYTHLFNNKWW